MSKPTPIGRTTVQQADKESVEKSLAVISQQLADGEICGMVAIVVRPDRSFSIHQVGDLRRIETIGLLAQAQFDLLTDEPPYPGRKFKPGA